MTVRCNNCGDDFEEELEECPTCQYKKNFDRIIEEYGDILDNLAENRKVKDS